MSIKCFKKRIFAKIDHFMYSLWRNYGQYLVVWVSVIRDINTANVVYVPSLMRSILSKWTEFSLPLHPILFSVLYIGCRFLNHLYWANTLVCLLFKLSKLDFAIKMNGHTFGCYVPLGSAQFYYAVNRALPKQHPYELCISCNCDEHVQDT